MYTKAKDGVEFQSISVYLTDDWSIENLELATKLKYHKVEESQRMAMLIFAMLFRFLKMHNILFDRTMDILTTYMYM